jgi:hypothetical protein
VFDRQYARRLIREYRLPITVEQYDSGQIGFVARPIVNGKRLNKSFSTSVYGNLEEAAQAAVEFCKQKAHEVRSQRQSELDRLVEQATKRGLDPVKVFHTGLLIHVKRALKKDLANES